jgi:CubicO group peptidase (beta-lactamase class C family)
VRAALAAAVLAVLVTAGAAAERGDAAPADLDARLQAVVDDLTQNVYLGAGFADDQEAFYVPGAALSVSLPGEPTRTYVAGVADVKRGTAVTPVQVQPIGSGTKPMTAALIIDLVRRGRLRLGERLTDVAHRYMGSGPQLAAIATMDRDRLRGITIRQLLSMTSGLRDYDDDPVYVRQFADRPTRTPTLTELAIDGLRRPPLFKPGAKGRSFYSNTNYILLGLVIEAVTGRSYARALGDLLHRHGIDATTYGGAAQVHGYANPLPKGGPALLGLYRKAFSPAPVSTANIDPAAVEVVSDDPKAEGPTVPIEPGTAEQDAQYGGPTSVSRQDLTDAYSLIAAGGTAGAVVSNTGDLARFWRLLFSGRLLGKDGLRMMKRSVPGDPGAPGIKNYFTNGFARQDVAPGAFWPGSPKLRIWFKLGDIWGYTSASYYVQGPAPFGGVVVTNTTNLFPSPVGDLGVLRQTLLAISGG